MEKKPAVVGFIAGLGGRDITVENFRQMVDETEKSLDAGQTEEYRMIGVRE
jgi:pyruvate ferredoxin oxidoreductase alpha subunit